MLDLILISTLGFLGSFGHCAGMCGPLAVAFSLSQTAGNPKVRHLSFHLLLNLGRITAYAIAGAMVGGLSSLLLTSGQLTGWESELRRAVAIITGLMLIWFGLAQIKPNLLPRLPWLHPVSHQRLEVAMVKVSQQNSFWMPATLGLLWGLVPCGFLYAAQIKAAETGNPVFGAATMFAFGLGTFPAMLGVGVFAGKLSADRRSQLFRMGGWVTIAIGLLTLLRTDAMVDGTGHLALLCLILALIARPVSKLWPPLLCYRRALGVGAFVLAVAHTAHLMDHSLHWNLSALWFLLPQHQVGMVTGMMALLLMMPAAITSRDRIQHYLGKRWRWLHLLTVPALLMASLHAILIGSHYLGGFEWTLQNKLLTALLAAILLAVLLVRTRYFWSLLSLEKFYVSPSQPK